MATITRTPTDAPTPPGDPDDVELARPGPLRPWRAPLLVLAVLLLAAVANGPALVRTAERQPLGWQRDLLVDVASAVAEVGDSTRLDRPRRWLDEALDREAPSGRLRPPVVAPRPSPPDAAPPPADEPEAAPSTSAPTTEPAAPDRRRPTAEAPLRLWIGGDSMMQVVGQSLVNAATATGVIAADLEFRVSTGLTRPDYFDWPTRLADVVGQGEPEAVVVMFGANDAQGIVTAHGPEPFGTDAWLAEYRARVAATMDLLVADGTRVYWIGQPIMRSEDFSARMAALDDIYRAEAEQRGDVVYVDAWSLFAVDGRYSAHLDQGGPTLMRQSDGIHLTRAGGDRLAAAVLDAIRVDWLEGEA